MKLKPTAEMILSARQTRIDDCFLDASPVNYNLNQSVAFTVRYRISGPLRERFQQTEWEKSYNVADNQFRLTLRTSLRKGQFRPIGNTLIKPEKYVRKAVIYWTRNPDLPYRVWAMVVNDYGQPTVPRAVEEAQALMFDITRTYEVEGAKLGSGTQTVVAQVGASWGRHTFIEKGRVKAASPPIKVYGKK